MYIHVYTCIYNMYVYINSHYSVHVHSKVTVHLHVHLNSLQCTLHVLSPRFIHVVHSKATVQVHVQCTLHVQSPWFIVHTSTVTTLDSTCIIPQYMYNIDVFYSLEKSWFVFSLIVVSKLYLTLICCKQYCFFLGTWMTTINNTITRLRMRKSYITCTCIFTHVHTEYSIHVCTCTYGIQYMYIQNIYSICIYKCTCIYLN